MGTKSGFISCQRDPSWDFFHGKPLKLIFNITAYSCDYRFRLQNSLGIGKLISHSHILTLCIQCYEG